MDIKRGRYWNSTEGPVTLADLTRFEYDSVNYIYDLEPSKPNLFWAGNFSSGPADNSSPPKPEDFELRKFFNAQHRIKSVSFKAPTVEVAEDSVIQHMSTIKKVTFSKEVSISWIEDVYESVRKYHMDWLYNWYDPTTDCMICGRQGKYRRFDLVLYHEKGNTETYEDPDIEPLFLITFRGLVPTSLPDYNFDKSSDIEQTVDISYHANYIGMFYNASLLESPNDMSVYGKKDAVSKALWKPLVGDETVSGEGHRLTHAITSSLYSEGRIG